MLPTILTLTLAASLPVADPHLLHRYSALKIAPSGESVAAIESDTLVGQEPPAHGQVVIRDTRGGRVMARYDPCATCRYSDLAFSRQGDTLAFLSADDEAGTVSIEVVEGSSVRTVTRIAGVAEKLAWSPDGTRFALLAIPSALKQLGPMEAGIPLIGDIGKHIEVERIGLVATAGGVLRYVSPEDRYVYEYDWTPDGKGFVATAAEGDGDNNWYRAKLVYIKADPTDTAAAARVMATPDFQMGLPRISADGRHIAFIAGLMSDYSLVGGDIWLARLDGGPPVNITPDFEGTFMSVVWQNGALIAVALIADKAAIIRINPDTGMMKTLWSEQTSIRSGEGGFFFSVATSTRGGRIAAVREDFDRPPAVIAGKSGALKPITHDNDGWKSLVSAKSLIWRNEGHEVQGWLFTPPNVQVGRTYPMLVFIHGGPGFAVTPSFAVDGTLRGALERGYYVFEANARGSMGYGEAFQSGNRRDFGGGDLHDMLAGVDAVEKIAPINDQRLGVFGGSYGGFMTMSAVTRTQRFKAAVAARGISDLFSQYGTAGISQWIVSFMGATAYDDPAIYDKLSPIRHIKDVRTPTLLTAGELDIECPPSQSLEFFNGLRAIGVPTGLVVYKGEGHFFHQPADIQDVRQRTLEWFDRYLQPE